METRDLYEVKITATQPDFNLSFRAFFDRIPTVNELLEVISLEYRNNEAYRPGVTAAVVELLDRGGLPAPPPEIAPDVGSMLSYSDGWITLTRTRRFIAATDAAPEED
jgi:hypothetical protein